jgi:hypothetical protein
MLFWNALTGWQWVLLAVTGVSAGLVDAIAGGGGLLTVPVLLSVGLPPSAALGTNKLQASFGSATAAWHYGRAGFVGVGRCVEGIAWTGAGAVLGALSVGRLSDGFLRSVIPVLLLAVLAFLVLRPRFGTVSTEARVPRRWFHGVAGLGLGAYDGFFGPGVGAFWTFAYMGLQGMDLLGATAHTKVMNFTSNAVALAVFAAGGQVCLLPGMVMAAGQLVGARVGARLVIYRGTRLVRPVFLAVVTVIAVKLLWPAP